MPSEDSPWINQHDNLGINPIFVVVVAIEKYFKNNVVLKRKRKRKNKKKNGGARRPRYHGPTSPASPRKQLFGS
jgi:hypothetical protein